MVSDIEKNNIKKIIIDILENKEDVKNIYIVESTGDLFSRYRLAKGENQMLEAIGLQNITKTRLGVAVTIKSSIFANIPELYEILKNEISEKLKEQKYNLYSLKLKVIDAE